MSHYRLLTELPPRPLVPGPPPLPFEALWDRCREELDSPSRAALEALGGLDDATPLAPDEDPAAGMRTRMEDALALAEEAGRTLLVEWMVHERALREALAARRAAALERPWPAAEPHVTSTMEALAPAVAAAMRLADPRLRQRAVDALRLERLDALVTDELSDDALLARVMAAQVVERWATRPATDPLEEVWT